MPRRLCNDLMLNATSRTSDRVLHVDEIRTTADYSYYNWPLVATVRAELCSFARKATTGNGGHDQPGLTSDGRQWLVLAVRTKSASVCPSSLFISVHRLALLRSNQSTPTQRVVRPATAAVQRERRLIMQVWLLRFHFDTQPGVHE